MDPSDTPDWLPSGWIMHTRVLKSGRETRYYTNLETGRMFSSKKEVLEYDAGCKVVSKRTLDDDLPPGWIKEIKVTNRGHKSRRDSYYTDPISGYIFQSRVDVERYLETGYISKRARLPRQRQINNQNLSLPSSEDQKQNVEEPATRSQLFEGEGSECISSVSLAEVEAPNQDQDDMITVQGRYVISPTVEAPPESPIGKTVEIGVETTPSYTLHISKYEPTNRNNISSGIIPVSAPATDKLSSAEQPSSEGEKRVEDHSTTRQLFEGNVDELTSNIPLTDFEPPKQDQDELVSVQGGMVTSLTVEIPAEDHSVGKGVETVDEKKANSCLYLSKNKVTEKSLISTDKISASADKLSEKDSLESGLENISGIGIKTMELKDTPDENLPSYKCKDPLQDQATQLETSLISYDKSETPIFLPFGDSSLDRCLEFAYKTLTGAISLDDIANDGTISTPVADIMQERNFDLSKVDNGGTVKALKSNKKELKFPRESSKVNNSRCGVVPIDDIANNGEIPTLVNASNVERSRTCKAQKSKKNELKLSHRSIKEFNKDEADKVENGISGERTRGTKLDVDLALVDGACQYPGACLRTKTVHRNSSKVNARNSSLPPATQNVPTLNHQEIENTKIHNKLTEKQPSFPFGGPCSDPCPEFAYKTTCAILIDRTPIQSQVQVQQQVVKSGVQNSNFSLPVFGMPYLPKCDLSHFFHSPEKQSASRQQLSLNSSRLPPSNSELYCSNTDPINRCIDGSCGTQEIHGKEESDCNRGSK